jgi:GH15 family glucan-1,4-alpha-glucosidase
VVRVVQGLDGVVAMRMELVLRFDYGTSVPWVTRLKEGGGLQAVAGPNMVALRTDVEVHGEDHRSVAQFNVAKGDWIGFTLSYAPSHLDLPAPIDVRAALNETEEFWKKWVGQSRYEGEWKAAVQRSLIVLKALTYEPTGGIVAAPTTSLPERLGGVRNWDYRFCWLRDATLTLQALMSAGYFEEAGAWRRWLLRSVAGSAEQVQIMYGLAGERRLNEWEADWLPGYQGARPVRIGNAASGQLQLDVYGEVIDAIYHARLGGLESDAAAGAMQRVMLDTLGKLWQQPDEGIWEVRGGRQHFTYSKIMAWVAFDRAIKESERYGIDAPLDSWRAVRQRIHDDVCAKAFDAQRGSFMQSYGSRSLDACLLLIPVTGFLPATDPRVKGTLAAVERELLVKGFVLRYSTFDTDDGLPPQEGAFLACSFWLVDSYILQGRIDEARSLFERLLAICNDVGLLAEEYDVKRRCQVGNFPQAFSHIALINTAFNLAGAIPGRHAA